MQCIAKVSETETLSESRECFCFLCSYMHTYKSIRVCVCVLELLPTRVACQISKSGRITVEVGGGRLLSCLPNVKSSNCAKLQKRAKKDIEDIFLLLLSVSTNLSIPIENSV